MTPPCYSCQLTPVEPVGGMFDFVGNFLGDITGDFLPADFISGIFNTFGNVGVGLATQELTGLIKGTPVTANPAPPSTSPATTVNHPSSGTLATLPTTAANLVQGGVGVSGGSGVGSTSLNSTPDHTVLIVGALFLGVLILRKK